MKRFPSAVLVMLAAGLAPACALNQPFRGDAPSTSREGIALAVVGQRCEQGNEPDMSEQLAEVTVLVRVHNPTHDLATIHRTDFRLVGDERFAVKTSTWGASDALDVPPGSDQTFDLRFMARGAFECAKEIQLDPGAGVVTRNQPVKLHPVAFVPRRA
jgi:hypothetical protein